MEEINQRKITAEKTAVRYRNWRRARDRALVRLSHLHPDTYKQLLEEERKADEETGKKWLDISGTTLISATDSGNTDSTHTHN